MKSLSEMSDDEILAEIRALRARRITAQDRATIAHGEKAQRGGTKKLKAEDDPALAGLLDDLLS